MPPKGRTAKRTPAPAPAPAPASTPPAALGAEAARRVHMTREFTKLRDEINSPVAAAASTASPSTVQPPCDPEPKSKPVPPPSAAVPCDTAAQAQPAPAPSPLPPQQPTSEPGAPSSTAAQGQLAPTPPSVHMPAAETDAPSSTAAEGQPVPTPTSPSGRSGPAEGVPPLIATLPLGRTHELQQLSTALELSGARVVVHGPHGVGRRTLMRAASTRCTFLRHKWRIAGHSEEAVLEGLAAFGREYGACNPDADSRTGIEAAKQLLATEDDWLLTFENVRAGVASRILAHVPSGRGRCMFSSVTDSTIWSGSCAQMLTCSTQLPPLPSALECMQTLCRTALQLPLSSPPPPEAQMLLSAEPGTAVADVIELLEGPLQRLPLGAVILGSAMSQWCDFRPQAPAEPVESRLKRGMEELVRHHKALSDSESGHASLLDDRPPQPFATAVRLAYGLVGKLASSRDEAVGAYAMLRCLLVLDSTAVAGVPEQVWTRTNENRHALLANSRLEKGEHWERIDVDGTLSKQQKAAKQMRKQAESLWMQDDATQCTRCLATFTRRVRKHHCRRCGKLICESCSSYRQTLPSRGYFHPVRHCTGCFQPPLRFPARSDLGAGTGPASKKRQQRAEQIACNLFTDYGAFSAAVSLLARCGLITQHNRRRMTSESSEIAQDRAALPHLMIPQLVQQTLIENTMQDHFTDYEREAAAAVQGDGDANGEAEARLLLSAAQHAAQAKLWAVINHRFIDESNTQARVLQAASTQSGDLQLCRPLLSVASGLAACPARYSLLPDQHRAALASARATVVEFDFGAMPLAELLYRQATAEGLSPEEAESDGVADQHALRVASARLALALFLMRQRQQGGNKSLATAAADLIHNAVITKRDLLGKIHEETVTAMRLHCDVLRAHEPPRYQDAVDVMQNLWQVTEFVLGRYHPNTATALMDLADIYEEAGNFDQAIKNMDRAIDSCQISQGSDHPRTITAVERRTAAYSRYRASRNQPLPTDAPPSAEDEIKRLQAEVSLARQLSRQDSAAAPKKEVDKLIREASTGLALGGQQQKR